MTETASASPVLQVVAELSQEALDVYRTSRRRVEEDASSETRISQGGYHEHSMRELVQNGLDEMRESADGRIHVVLTATHLYCSNTGNPVTPEGAETILRMGVSRKRGGQVGRFGVGVKSVLSVTDTPQFFSTSGSFGFDREWSAEQIRAVQPGVTVTPVLRLGRALDLQKECSSDPVLRELMDDRAATVVRLPLLPGTADRLGTEIGAFPTDFPVFSPHVSKVVFEDRRRMPVFRREIRHDHDGVRHNLQELRVGAAKKESAWKVFTTSHKPTAEMQSVAGELHSRPEIDISWAVPEYKRDNHGLLAVPNERGKFWAHFPTTQATTLSGYLNAAWKTSEDRGALYDGSPFNVELLRAAASLVVDSLPTLVAPEDPGAYLALLPGRTKESPNRPDRILVEAVWKAAAGRPSLPDQDGVLRRPVELRIHPKLVDMELLRIWGEYSGRPKDWVHRSVEAHPVRHGKMEHILAETSVSPSSAKEWLEALVSDGSAAASTAAIQIAAQIVQQAPHRRGEGYAELVEGARRARIVLTERHGLVAPLAGKVYRRTSEDGLRDDLVYVHPDVVNSPNAERFLQQLGVQEADASGRFRAVLAQGFRNYTADSWTRFWELLRSAGGRNVLFDLRAEVPDPLSVLNVRTVDGRFRRMRDCLLPGPVVPGDGSRDTSIAVDMRFHTDDRGIFRELGLVDRPTSGHKPEEEEWFEEYKQALFEHYSTSNPGAGRSSIKRMRLEGSPVAGPLHLLPELSDEGKAAFVAALPDEGVVENWIRQMGAQASSRSQVVSPLRWMLRKHGLVPTDNGPAALRDAVGPQLSDYSSMLPVARISPLKATKLMLPTTLDAVPGRMWGGVLERITDSTDDQFVGTSYALLLRLEVPFPEDAATRCRVGSEWSTRPDGEIAVTADRAEYKSLIAEQVPALLAPSDEDVERMVEEWGMLRVKEVIAKELRYVASGEPMSLVDEYPPLRARLGRVAGDLRLLPCSELEEIVRTPSGTRPTPLSSALKDQHTVLVLNPKDSVETLIAADKEFGWRLGASGCRQVVNLHRKQMQDRATQAQLNAIRGAEGITDKILLLIGEESLRAGLPEGLLDSEIQESGRKPNGRRVAELAYFAHGEEVLRLHKKDIAAAFPALAPDTYGGSTSAVRFVTDLGFPESFAGVRTPSLEPVLTAEGPTEFPGLHSYQERLATNLVEMLEQPSPQRRMLSLPTGAGKTRVTAEAVIRWIRQGGARSGPVLWIAQTEELCEQAVQSWSFVWSKVGARQQLVINRLWTSNEATAVSDKPQLVVATDAKLALCLDTPEYAWLCRAELVIVDEAHVAMSPRYTELLGTMGLTQYLTERHLVGLTATPFRRNSEETRLLVNRFSSPGTSRLDEGIFAGDPYEELQKLGMLAEVEHRVLSGATIELNAKEQEHAQQMRVLPKSAEQRIADNYDRNNRLVDEILGVEPLGPVLLFATSVAHAKLMAAKLNSQGVRAAAIDSATRPAERRSRVDSFRRGDTRVLTNYGVLAQGFDAPATRTVVVARPTYSPNIYQQMIGRGLRGPKNGGEDKCLILNVDDNIANFGEALAFNGFEHLWKNT